MTSAPIADVLLETPTGTEDDEKLSRGRIAAAIIFGLLAVAFIAAGLIMVALPADRLPGLLGHAATRRHHSLRGVGSALVGLALMVSSWFALRYRSLALEEARAADLAAVKDASQADTAGKTAGKADAAPEAAGLEAGTAENN